MLKRLALLLLVAACGHAAAPPSTPPPAPVVALQPGDLAITDVTVVPMATPGEVAHQTVVVRGDRIVAIAPAASLAVPSTVKTIDGKGRWLMPGLTDMHVHMWSDADFPLYLASGVTLVRNMFGSEQVLAWRDRIAKGEVQGPTIVTAGPIIDGDPPVWPGSAVLTDPAKADALVADQKAKGYDFLKPYSRLSKPAYEALAAAGAKHGMLLEGHVPGTVGLTGVLAAKQRTIEHLDGWLLAMVADGVELPDDGVAIHAMRAALPKLDNKKLPGLIRQTIAAGTWNCPTLVVYDRMSHLDDVESVKRRVAWLDKVPPMTLSLWEPKQDFRLRSMTGEDYATMRGSAQKRTELAAALVAANAPILVGTDTGNPFVVPGAALHDELELLVAAGIPRDRVLRAATSEAARFLGTPSEFGVIAPGARADLLLVAIDPLAAPLPAVPDAVIVRGKVLERAQLEATLDAIAKGYAAPPAAKDRWQGVAPLAIAKPVHEARYDIAFGGFPVGEERLAVAGTPRRVAAQMVLELPQRIEIAYALSPTEISLDVKLPTGALHLAGKVVANQLTVTGTDGKGQTISLTAAAPKGTILVGPGVAGGILFAPQLTKLAVGGKLTLPTLELSYFPAPALQPSSIAVERKPDVDGNRVYATVATLHGQSVPGTLTFDARGYLIGQTAGPPLNFTATRRAK